MLQRNVREYVSRVHISKYKKNTSQFFARSPLFTVHHFELNSIFHFHALIKGIIIGNRRHVDLFLVQQPFYTLHHGNGTTKPNTYYQQHRINNISITQNVCIQRSYERRQTKVPIAQNSTITQQIRAHLTVPGCSQPVILYVYYFTYTV